MRISSIRELAALKPVLKDPSSSGPDPVYWVFGEISEEKWANMTITTAGRFNGEYPKMFGHYHGVDVNETYRLISGEGVFYLQKKHYENGQWIPEMVDEVYLIKAKPGDEITITAEYGHHWSNIGNEPLVTFDDWRSGHKPTDYSDVEKLRGMAYYLVEENGEIKTKPNPNYKNSPEPMWITSKEFSERGGDV